MNAITDLKRFMLAGHAIFTVVSKATQTRFTFKVSKPDEMDPARPLYFVGVLNGSSNEANYSYLGLIRGDAFEHGRKSKITADAPSAKAARWIVERTLHGQNLPNCDVYHEGKCARCGRRLTVPESILSGFGPECATR